MSNVSVKPSDNKRKEEVALELIHIVVDFIALGAIGMLTLMTVSLWWLFTSAFVFEPGYLSFINRHPVLKAILVIGSGITIWGAALYKIHMLLWG